jgi:HSP20 family molecular chaperone IbpA
MSLTNYFFNNFAAFDYSSTKCSAHMHIASSGIGIRFRTPSDQGKIGSFSEKCFLTRVRRMDVHQDKDTNAVTASFDIPGLRKEDVAIGVHNDVLTVSGESKSASERSEDEMLSANAGMARS